jgi:hypothetical protein
LRILKLTSPSALMKKIRKSIARAGAGAARAAAGAEEDNEEDNEDNKDSDAPEGAGAVQYPFSNLDVLASFIQSYFEQDIEKRAVTIDETSLDRFMALPIDAVAVDDSIPKDDWIKDPILKFRWNLEYDLVKLLPSSCIEALEAERMTLDEFVKMLIAEHNAPHPLHLVWSGGTKDGGGGCEVELPRGMFSIDALDKEEQEKDEKTTMVRDDFDGFEEVTKKICTLLSNYMKEGVCGTHGDAKEKTNEERLVAVSGLGTTIAHTAMFQAALLENTTKITPPPNLGKHMETLLKATLGHQDSKKKRKNQSLVNGAKDRSVFGMALEHAPQIITKYGELLSHIIDGKQDGSNQSYNNKFFVPDTNTDVENFDANYSGQWSSSSFDRIQTAATAEMKVKAPGTYNAVKSIIQPSQAQTIVGEVKAESDAEDDDLCGEEL